MKTKPAGLHLIIDFWGGKEIKEGTKLRNILLEAARISKNTPVGTRVHRFSPSGISGFVLLAESHISIHTWPEKDYVAIDIFSCGNKSKPYKGLEYLKKVFEPKKVKIKELKRG